MLNKQQRKYIRRQEAAASSARRKKDGWEMMPSDENALVKKSKEEALDAYVLACSDPEGDYLYRLYRATNIYTVHGRMASGHLQGRLLKMFVRMVNPKHILEVGTFSGYSAICLAEGLAEGGKVWTFEINDEQEDFTRPWIENSHVADKINFIIGNAIEEAPKLGVAFDMAFVDGDKKTYIEAYEMVLSVLRPGGIILADNTLWDGHVVDEAYQTDKQTQGIDAFNHYVAQDDRVERVMIPLRDGLTVIRKKVTNPDKMQDRSQR